jgi:hypothetical protein
MLAVRSGKDSNPMCQSIGANLVTITILPALTVMVLPWQEKRSKGKTPNAVDNHSRYY